MRLKHLIKYLAIIYIVDLYLCIHIDVSIGHYLDFTNLKIYSFCLRQTSPKL